MLLIQWFRFFLLISLFFSLKKNEKNNFKSVDKFLALHIFQLRGEDDYCELVEYLRRSNDIPSSKTKIILEIQLRQKFKRTWLRNIVKVSTSEERILHKRNERRYLREKLRVIGKPKTLVFNNLAFSSFKMDIK